MIMESKTLVISFDLDCEKDYSVATIFERDGFDLKYLQKFVGKEAHTLYWVLNGCATMNG